MRTASIYLLILVMFWGSACKKEVKDMNVTCIEPGQPQLFNDAKAFLKDVVSDDSAEYYISGEFDGYKIYCASTLAHLYPGNAVNFNVLFFNDSINLDNIHLVRENKDISVLIALYFDQAKISTRQFPYIVPRANLDKCENVQMELINMKKIGTTGQGAPNDDFSFWGYTGSSSLKVKVTSFIDYVMEGTFEGNLTTKTGATIVAKNGKFRIKIQVVDPIKGNGNAN